MEHFLASVVLVILIGFTYGLSEQYEIAQQQLEEEMKVREREMQEEAITKGYKMRNGVGGVTISIHYPTGKKLVHRNKWTFYCQTKIDLKQGYCPGIHTQSLALFKPKKPEDYCYIKTFVTIGDHLCLSQGTAFMRKENETISCTTTNRNFSFPTYVTTIDSYLDMCKNVSENVTYIYYKNPKHRDRVNIPIKNHHLLCRNFDGQNSTVVLNETTTTTTTTTERYVRHTLQWRRFVKSDKFIYRDIWNKDDICLWREPNVLRIFTKGFSANNAEPVS